MKKSILFIAFSTAMFTSAMAQNNLVPNPGFDETEKKVKGGQGEISLATGWYSPDEEKQADLFSETVKKEYGQPENIKGYQMPESGSNYAGIRVWVGRGSDPITYIQAKLNDKLIAGKSYCVSFKVSLADLSKYGNAHIGAYISAKKPRSRDLESGEVKPNIQHSTKRIYKDTYMWETVCSVFKAQGGESYITIGGFVTPEAVNEKTETERLKMSSQFRGQRQTEDSYFFIEDVSVINLEEIGSCDCEAGESGNEMEVVYSENVGETDGDVDPSQTIELMKVYFDEGVEEPVSTEELDEVVNLMINNQGLQLTVIGHTDKKEELSTTVNLSEQRAKKIKAYLVENGVEDTRVSTKAMKANSVVDESGTKMGMAKNRRVEFEVSGE
ncbi:MAG: hypothetical protein CL843_05570 [Crocinitomicaceae bacterium]|nr:hypothetical protein [Crocinitomicaceae bacterium]